MKKIQEVSHSWHDMTSWTLSSEVCNDLVKQGDNIFSSCLNITTIFIVKYLYFNGKCGIVKKNSQPQCCYFLNLLLIFQNSEEAVLFYLWHIRLAFIFLILILVFVVEMQQFKKEMHSHKLSAMVDHYPADWCINRADKPFRELPGACWNSVWNGVEFDSGMILVLRIQFETQHVANRHWNGDSECSIHISAAERKVRHGTGVCTK